MAGNEDSVGDRHVPECCEDLLEGDVDLRTAIPELARDTTRMAAVEAAVEGVPTEHEVSRKDARELDLEGESDLIVTSPPYFDLKEYEGDDGQLGDADNYGEFRDELTAVWSECYDALCEGGRMCVVVGDVLRSRGEHGRHHLLPLHAAIQEDARSAGFDALAPIIWRKVGNTGTETGDNSRFLGKPYEPGAAVENDIEYILLFRKPGGYRSPTTAQRILSTIDADRHQSLFTQVWDGPSGEGAEDHPAPYPAELAERLIRMFSFVGDTVLDPFAGTGTTAVAASRVGRNSLSTEVAQEYVDMAEERLRNESKTLVNWNKMTVEAGA